VGVVLREGGAGAGRIRELDGEPGRVPQITDRSSREPGGEPLDVKEA
jgi:hypothetical protein